MCEPMEAAICCYQCGRAGEEPFCWRCKVATAGPEGSEERDDPRWWFVAGYDHIYRQKRWADEPKKNGMCDQPGVFDHTGVMNAVEH
jgi:hypothetical protein